MAEAEVVAFEDERSAQPSRAVLGLGGDGSEDV
jgi:hypothetical protein